MRSPVQLGEHPAQTVFDGAIGLALAAGVPLRLSGPLASADLALALAAVKLGGDPDPARELLSREGPVELSFPHPRAGVHVLELPHPGLVARALWTLSWPLALLGRPSELRLRGPNHNDGQPTFHDLRLGWAHLAAQFGLKIGLELTQAGFGSEEGEIVAALDPAPALTPLRAVHRGLLRQVGVIAAVGGGRYEAALEAAERVVREMRRRGVIAEAERVPLPLAASSAARGRWALTATAEFENSVVTVSTLGQTPAPAEPEQGDRLAERLARFLGRRGALDASMGERLLLPSCLCAGGLGARAGAPPSCHYTASEITSGLLELATLARQALPVRAVVDGAEGEEGVIVVAPQA
ncbi:MAG TPA: RNA 3'-terminal phosphate cyclase [Myxococcales bacterium]|nr:RNA 3'-terminal phosphate cyclase [Myxococcales bacterium]